MLRGRGLRTFCAPAHADAHPDAPATVESLEPRRLLSLAVELGCHFSIDTDAHAPGQLEWQAYGCDRAVECEVPAERVINTWGADELLEWVAS